MTVRDSLPFKAALLDGRLGVVSSVEEIEYSTVIENLDRPCFVASCYTDRRRTICERYDDFVLILHNSYLLSFVDNIGLAWLHHRHTAPLDLGPFTIGFAKKFVAEQMLRIKPSSMGRVLFLETMLAYEPHWRKPVEERERDPELSRASRRLTAITADLLLHHEIGHTATDDTRFRELVRLPVKQALSQIDLSALSERQVSLLQEESEADIFGIDCCVALYAPSMSADQVREYLIFSARAVIALNILYAFADDLHRLNVDEAYKCESIDDILPLWAYRELIMIDHINSFAFGEDTVETAAEDDVLAIGNADELFEQIMSGRGLVHPPSEDHRRAAEVIDAGFSETGNFDAVIDSVRSSWMLDSR